MSFLNKPVNADVAKNTAGPQADHLVWAYAFTEQSGTALANLAGGDIGNAKIQGSYEWGTTEGGHVQLAAAADYIDVNNGVQLFKNYAAGTFLIRATLIGGGGPANFVMFREPTSNNGLQVRTFVGVTNWTIRVLGKFSNGSDRLISMELDTPVSENLTVTILVRWDATQLRLRVNGVDSDQDLTGQTYATGYNNVAFPLGNPPYFGFSNNRCLFLSSCLWDTALTDDECDQIDNDPHMMIRRKPPFDPQFSYTSRVGETTATVIQTSETGDTTARGYRVHYGLSEAEVLAETNASSVVLSTTSANPERLLFALTGLIPNSTYYYKVQYRLASGAWYDLMDNGVATGSTADGQAYIGQFKVRGAASSTAKIGIIGDLHVDGNPGNIRSLMIPRLAHLASRVKTFDPDAVIQIGDYDFGFLQTLQSSADAEAASYRNDIREITDFYPYYQVIGNHESFGLYLDALLGDSGLSRTIGRLTHLRYFGNPATADSSNEVFYDFVVGPVHCFVVEPYTGTLHDTVEGWRMKPEEYAWLDSALAASTARWKVVLFHQLFGGDIDYGRGGPLAVKNAGTYMARYLHPLFVRHKVDVCVYDHDHVYSYGNIDDVHYVTASSPTIPFTPIGQSSYTDAEFVVRDKVQAFGYVELEATEERMTVSLRRTNSSADALVDELITAFVLGDTGLHAETAQDALGLDDVRGAYVDANAETRFDDRSQPIVDSNPSGGEHKTQLSPRLASR